MGNKQPKTRTFSQQPKEAEIKERNQKILFLGAADSGKSTLLNQIKFIENGDKDSEITTDMSDIVFNRLLSYLINYVNLFANDNRCQSDSYQFINDIIDNKISFEELYNENKEQFTKENLFTKLKENFHKLNSEDNVEYLLNNLERILIKKEITELDYLSSYRRTTGILEYKTKTNNFIITSGGQRGERKKWIHTFDSVTTLGIFVSLSEFNQTCYEDNSTNRLKESLDLFEELFNSKWFVNVNMLLIFTKVDCFIKKINSGIHFSNYFNDFTGSNYNPKEVFEFIVEKFSEKCKERELRYCALNCLDKFACMKVREIVENMDKYKYQNEIFISKQLLISGKDLNQMFTKLYQATVNLNYCDIELFTIYNQN